MRGSSSLLMSENGMTDMFRRDFRAEVYYVRFKVYPTDYSTIVRLSLPARGAFRSAASMQYLLIAVHHCTLNANVIIIIPPARFQAFPSEIDPGSVDLSLTIPRSPRLLVFSLFCSSHGAIRCPLPALSLDDNQRVAIIFLVLYNTQDSTSRL
jgi:hypothetical protein